MNKVKGQKSSDSQFREKGNQNLAKDQLADRYFLMKNNKITAEEQYKDKPGKTCSEGNAFMVGNTKIVGNMSIIRQTRVHYMVYPLCQSTTGIKISMILPPQHWFKLQLILSSVANYLGMCLCATVKQFLRFKQQYIQNKHQFSENVYGSNF